MTDIGLNPRYANYCRAHGRTPDEQLEHDRREWRGGTMCGFILWHSERLGEARRALPNAFVIGGGLWNHAAYDAWLTERVDRNAAIALLTPSVKTYTRPISIAASRRYLGKEKTP